MTVAETKVSPERQFVQGICRTAAGVTLDLTGGRQAACLVPTAGGCRTLAQVHRGLPPARTQELKENGGRNALLEAEERGSRA
jgi:hypothetical protein